MIPSVKGLHLRPSSPSQPRCILEGVAMSNEEWRPVVGFPKYEVSNLGRVKSLVQGKRFGKIRKLVPNGRKREYLAFSVYDGSKMKILKAHSEVLKAFVGPRPEGYDVCHKNGNPSDNRLENLEYGTKRKNSLDALEHGTHPGIKNRKFSKGQVFEMYKLDESGVPLCEIEKRYGLRPSGAHKICRGINYKAFREEYEASK